MLQMRNGQRTSLISETAIFIKFRWTFWHENELIKGEIAKNVCVRKRRRKEDLLELSNESIDCLQTRASLYLSKHFPVTVQFSSEGVQPTAVRVSIQVEKSIWFYVWSKSIDWEIRALTESEPYKWVSLNIQKEYGE